MEIELIKERFSSCKRTFDFLLEGLWQTKSY